MVRNRNGYWMSPKFGAMFAEDSGGGTGGAAGSEGSAGAEGAAESAGNAENAGGEAEKTDDSSESLQAEIARLKAEMAKQKTALDAATSEAGKYRKELRAKQTAEEIAANEKKEADEKQAQELEELRRKVAKGETVKSVMGKLGLDETAAGNLADHLYGAADIDNALLEIQKSWQAREAALRKEFGKITGPGAGADSNSPEAQGVARAIEFGKKQGVVNEQAQKAINAYVR